MSFGLLRGAFRPTDAVCALRAVWRHRDMLLSYQARHVQHLQKALTQMNVQLHHVITDIMGVTGQAIIRARGWPQAIVAGERDAATLAKLRDRRIKANVADVTASLKGHWRDEHVFALKQALALIDVYAEQITQCDDELQRLLGALKAHELPDDGLGTPKRGTPARNAVRFDARASLFEASGVDLTRIPGIDTSTALKVISEVGTDLGKRVARPPRIFRLICAYCFALTVDDDHGERRSEVGLLGEAHQGMANERAVAQRVLPTRRTQAHDIRLLATADHAGSRRSQGGEAAGERQ